MIDILLFANDEPGKVFKIPEYSERIMIFDQKFGLMKTLDVSMKFATFRDDTSGVILVAADRYVSWQEILDAYHKFF